MIYDLLAPYYDAINSDIDYTKWADFIEKILNKECKSRPDLILDLGCGTGKMTLELAKRGYDMTGIDYSPEMLDIARSEAEEKGATVLMSFSPMNRGAIVDADEDTIYRFFLRLQDSFYCRIISDPNNYIMESGWFYDNNLLRGNWWGRHRAF